MSIAHLIFRTTGGRFVIQYRTVSVFPAIFLWGALATGGVTDNGLALAPPTSDPIPPSDVQSETVSSSDFPLILFVVGAAALTSGAAVANADGEQGVGAASGTLVGVGVVGLVTSVLLLSL